MTALFLIVPSSGHLNATFRLARQLQTDGYRIIYALSGSPELAQHISHQGFELHWLQSQPFGVGLDEMLNRGRRESYLETLMDRFTGRDFCTRTEDLERTVYALKPTLILLDAFMSTDFIILYPLLKNIQTQVVLIQTMLSTYDDGVAPPLNTTLIPGQDSSRIIKQAWKRYYRNRTLLRIWQMINYFCQSPHRLVRRKFRQNNLPNAHQLLDNKVFHTGFDNLSEWIMAPREFDFPERQVLPHQTYLGLMVDLSRTEDLPATYLKVMKQITQERQSNLNLKLIYVSLGTVTSAHVNHKDVARFFSQLFEAVATEPNWRAIITLDPKLKNDLMKHPSNGYILDWVPQLHMLQQCDLFITHGGLNSVLEGWTLGVPMLVYPLNNAWDQMGNAARIVSHRKGLLGDFRKDKAGSINQAIQQLLIRNPTFPEI